MTCLPILPVSSTPNAGPLPDADALPLGQADVTRRATLVALKAFLAAGATGAAGAAGSGSTAPTGSAGSETGTAGAAAGRAPPGRLGYPASTTAVRNTAITPVAVTVPPAPSRKLPAYTATNPAESPNGKVLDKTNHATDSITMGNGTKLTLVVSPSNPSYFRILLNGKVMSGRVDLVVGVGTAPNPSFDDAIQVIYYHHNAYVMTDHGLGAQTWFKIQGSGPDVDTEADDPRKTFLVADAVAPAGDPPYGLGSHPGSIGDEPRFSRWAAEFIKEVGRISYVNAFADGSDFSSWGNNAYAAARSLAASPTGTNVVPVYGLPMARGGQAIADFTAFGNGTYDQHIKDGVKGYFAFFDEVHVRPGYEMNGTFMNWFWGGQNGDTTTGPLWLAAFKRIYTMCHQAAAEASASSGKTKTVAVTWNPCHQNYNAGYNPKDVYPGNDYCDYHGLDIYSPQYTLDPSNWSGDGVVYDTSDPTKWRIAQAKNPINRVHFWDYPAAKYGIGGGNETGGTAGWGMQDAIAFAKSCGKPLAFPECGAGQNFADEGKGPSEDEVFPYYLRSRCDQAVNMGVPILYLNIWSADEKDGGWGYMFRQRPKQAIAWSSAFGGTGAARRVAQTCGAGAVAPTPSEVRRRGHGSSVRTPACG